MNMIVAVDENWAIGNDNKLLVSIPSDMKFFRDTTMGKVVVMGRKTLESFPGGRPLKNRVNIVLTSRKDYAVKDVTVCADLTELFEKLRGFSSEDIYVIGGGSIYRQLLPYCDTVHVTKIHHAYQADTWFPDLDKTGEWEITASSEEQTYFNLEFVFLRYQRKAQFPPRPAGISVE